MARVPTTNTDLAVEESRSSIARSRARRSNAPALAKKRRRAAQAKHFGRKLVRVALLWVAIVVGMIAFGLISPIGLGVSGVIIAAMLALLGTALLLIYPKLPAVTEASLLQSDIRTLPLDTEIWLESQRPALPAPAQTLVDGIGVQLETLSDQLASVDAREPATEEVRRLVGEHLPDLINGYKRVPEAMRGQAMSSGKSADQQLVESLGVIERQIGQMSEDIAKGDLDALATRGRYLEIKYQGDNV